MEELIKLEERVGEKEKEQMNEIEMLIRDEIRSAFPEYNLRLMDHIGEATSSLRD